jgi:hypothetical protein
MNKIKILQTNIYNVPTIIQLTKNNKSIILNKINCTKKYNKYYTIKNNNYA